MRRRPRPLRLAYGEVTYWWRQLQRHRRGTPSLAELEAEELMNAALDRLPR